MMLMLMLMLQVILICCAVTANLRPKSAIPTFFPFDDNHLGDIFPNQVIINFVIIAIIIAKKCIYVLYIY